MVAEEIKRAYPTLTVHGLTHLDALWEMADLLMGPDYPLNPAEAFVLGGAFLTHDLGNGLAAYPQGEAELRATAVWRDALAVRLRRETGRPPTDEELGHPSPEHAQRATEDALRLLHATQAEKLALLSWKGPRGEPLYLIEDSELLAHFGTLVGELAHSHWQDLSEVEKKFSKRKLGAIKDFPLEWTVDALKLACLLRVADASHLDARRAPAFLQALRRPEGVSKGHWDFQRKLTKPSRDHDRLCYSAGEPFSPQEASAFWICFDALRMVDGELRDVDRLLLATHRKRLAVRGVTDVDDPTHLVTHIPTEGWLPVDARIHVSDVPSLVGRLGGAQLYGNKPWVPLRELIQNAADAIRARRVLEKRAEDWGTITVRTGEDERGTWLEVEDTGIGMSQRVLTRHLLNFGGSYWDSEDMRRDHPGLAASRFEHTGQFGIGFFSVFMWGKRLRVTSRPYQKAETRVLEFEQGLRERPILRPATSDERILDGGTRVRVWLESPKTLTDMTQELAENCFGIISRQLSVAELLGRIAPALDVNLEVDSPDHSRVRAVSANDWMSMDASLLLRRTGTDVGSAEFLAPMMGPIHDAKNRCIGRACFTSTNPGGLCITVGGLRASHSYSDGMAGILLATTNVATRHQAQPLATLDHTPLWATEQAKLWNQHSEPQTIHDYMGTVAQKILMTGGNPSSLPILGFADNKPVFRPLLEHLAICKKVEALYLPAESIISILRNTPLGERFHEPVPNNCIFFNRDLDYTLSEKLELTRLEVALERLIAQAWGVATVKAQLLAQEGHEYGWLFQRPDSSPADSPAGHS